MENKLNEVGRAAIRIEGPAAHDLIDYYNQFSRGDTTRLDTLKKEGKGGRREVAVILRRLTTVAKEVDLPLAEKHCAQTLLDFNGGTSCVQVYVNQHDFFMNKTREHVDHGDNLWSTISNPDESTPRSESGLTELFGEIRATVAQESQIVQAVFPNPPLVMQVFLQRVFAQPVRPSTHFADPFDISLIDTTIYRTTFEQREFHIGVGVSTNTAAHHVETSALVDDLKKHELPSLTPSRSSSLEAAEFCQSLNNTPSAAHGATATTVSAMLETAMEELFMPYTEGQKYIDRESKSLTELYANLLSNFTQYHMRTQREKGKTNMFDRMVDRLGAAAANTSTTIATSTTSAQAAAAIMRFGSMMTDRALERNSEEGPREEDGLLNIEMAEKMLRWHAEAVGRCVELSAQSDAPKNTFILLKVLAEAIATSYLEVAVETAHARIEFADSKVEPSLQALSMINTVDLVCHFWQHYVNVALFPLAAVSVTIRREMSVFNNQAVSRVEGATNSLLQRLTDAIISWLTLQLGRQKKNDFKPRNDDQSFARVNTEPCVACCETLEKVRDAAFQNLSGKNREVFLTEIGTSFHSLLLDHLRKFPVSATGGLMLAKDLKSYQDTVVSFNVPSLPERYEFIRQLGNVFLFENRFNEASEMDDTAGDMATKGLKDRFKIARLSTMMKELEGLKLGDGIAVTIPSASAIAQNFAVTGRS
ncbi:exocyst complex component Sec10-like protein [Chiua virens]|nr:exocyst complex component Sec10-like protein [Chiua virens]